MDGENGGGGEGKGGCNDNKEGRFPGEFPGRERMHVTFIVCPVLSLITVYGTAALYVATS